MSQSFVAPTPSNPVIVVGCGKVGLWCAKRLIDDQFCTADSLLLVDQQPSLGGLWSTHSFANSGARIQTLEPMMRLIEAPPEEGGEWPEFVPRAALLRQMNHLVDTYGWKDCFRFGMQVEKVIDRGTQTVLVCRSADGNRAEMNASFVLLCTGHLMKQREQDFKGESVFRGPIMYGQGAAVDELPDGWFRGKELVCLGMGAQAVENARTALLKPGHAGQCTGRGISSMHESQKIWGDAKSRCFRGHTGTIAASVADAPDY